MLSDAKNGDATPPSIEGAERLYSPAGVDAAVSRIAAAIDETMQGDTCVALCILQGGIVFTGMLLPRLNTPLQLDSIHVTRYRGQTSGGDLEWHALPRTPVRGRQVLLLDDILDEGHSLAAVRDWCFEQGAAEVRIAVLVEKEHRRKHPDVAADIVGLRVEDRYVVGYGMDYGGWYRNAPGIFALDEGVSE